MVKFQVEVQMAYHTAMMKMMTLIASKVGAKHQDVDDIITELEYRTKRAGK